MMDSTAKTDAAKYKGSDHIFQEAVCLIREAEQKYIKDIFNHYDNTTKREMRDEFWQRLAEYYGFKIDMCRENTAPSGEE